MNRYRVAFRRNGTSTFVNVEAPSAADAIAKLALEHPDFELLGVRHDPLKGEAPVSPLVDPLVAIESLAKALVRCNTILLALMNNAIFSGSLTPERRAQLEGVVRDAQIALDLAGIKVSR